MSGWLIAAGLIVFGLAVFLAFRFAGSTIVRQLAGLAVTAALETLKADRMDPETEARWRDCIKSGGRWDNSKKRCLPPR